MVRPALATRRHVSRGPHPLGRRDPAAMVRPGHSPHDARTVRSLFAGHAHGPPTRPARPTDTTGGVVCEVVAHVRRCSRPRSPGAVARRAFFNIAFRTRYGANSPRPV